MKVKIGKNIYDSSQEPIMIILTNGEKKQIAEMPEELTKYCQYPLRNEYTKNNYRKIKRWMKV